MGAVARIILCYHSTQEQYGSSRAQRGSVTRPAPAAQQSAPQRGDDAARLACQPRAAVWQGGMSMRGGRAARAVHIYNIAQAAWPRRAAMLYRCTARAA